jgi:hypothetical protein
MPYCSKTDHRDGTRVKSQWTIPFEDEESSFDRATESKWSSNATVRWGLHFRMSSPENLGDSAAICGTPPRRLFIAKFVDGNARDSWHGYPADPYKNQQDIPPTSVLKAWLVMSYFRPALTRKLAKGQLCAL